MSEQPLARSEVELELDFDDLDEELRRDLARRVKRAAKTAEKEIGKIPRASRKAGEEIAEDLAGGVAEGAARVRRAARQVEAGLLAAAEAGGEFGDAVDASADRSAGALGRVERAARDVQEALFDIGGDGGFVEIRRQVEAVQESLFDLDTVEIERVKVEAEAAADSLGRRFVAAAGRARAALGRFFLTRPGRGQGAAGGIEGLADGVEELGLRAEKSGRQLDRYSGRLAILASAIAFAAGAAPTLIAAGAGIAAALGFAVAPIVAVVQGTTELADRWDGLTRAQRIAVGSTRRLADEYEDLSASLEPESLRLYNAAVSEAISLLPKLVPLAEETTEALTGSLQTIGQGFESKRAEQFFDFLRSSAGPATEQVTALLLDLGAALASTVQALAPLAPVVFGVVGGLLRLLTLLNDISPAFAQIAVTAIALRAPLAGIGGALQSGAGRAAKFADGAGKAAGAARALNRVASVSPNIYLAAATAIAFFAVQAINATSAVDSTINSINGFNRAMGNNIAGYRAANKQLSSQLIPTQQRLAEAMRAVGREASVTNIQLFEGALAADDFVSTPIAEAMTRNVAAIGRVKDAARQLVDQGLAPSVKSAIRLADAAGVNLSKALDENGRISASTASKIATYSASVAMADDTTLVLADAWRRAKDEALGLQEQTKALQQAFDRFLNPSLAVLDASNRLREVQAQMEKAFKKGKVSALQRQQFLSQEIAALRDKLIAEQRATGATTKTTAQTLKLLPALSKLAGDSKAGREAVFALARSLDGATEGAKGAVTIVDRLGNRIRVLPNGKVIKIKGDTRDADGKLDRTGKKVRDLPDGKVTVTANVSPAQAAISRLVDQLSNRRASIPIGIRAPGATGGLVTPVGILPRFAGGGRVHGPGGPRSDRVPALLSAGEYVINARSTRKYFRLIEAINAGRFADGGPVGPVGPVRRFADGGPVSRAQNVRVGVLLGLDLSKGLERQLSKRVKAIGEKLGRDLTRSLVGTPAEINRAVRGLEKAITQAFRGIRTQIDNRLIKRLERVNKRLVTLAGRRDRLADRLAEAQQFRSAAIERTAGFAGVLGLTGDEGGASAADLAAALRDRLATIRRFSRDIRTLAARGLDKGIIRQLVEGGPEQAAELARTLATSRSSALRQISGLQAEIDRESRSFGTSITDTLFDAGRQAGKGFLTGLKAERKEIVALMTEIARSVSATVRRTLKIKSPSRVLEQDAEDTIAGYVRGLRRLREQVQAELARTVAPGRQVERARALAPARPRDLAPAAEAGRGREVTVQQTNHIHNVLDPNAVVDIIEGRLVAALR